MQRKSIVFLGKPDKMLITICFNKMLHFSLSSDGADITNCMWSIAHLGHHLLFSVSLSPSSPVSPIRKK